MILAFDTSGPWVTTAVLSDDTVISTRFMSMAKGQAEHLMPLIEVTLAEAKTDVHHLTAIGVGVGPGNFTGIRISVSAARGLALALGIPAIGVSTFDACYHAIATGPTTPVALVTVPGPRDGLYAQAFGTHDALPRLLDATDPLPHLPAQADPVHVTLEGTTLPDRDWRPLVTRVDAGPLAPAIARVAAHRMHSGPFPRPAPLYIKPADAAPSRTIAPKIL